MASRILHPSLFHASFRTPLFAAGLGVSSALIISPLLFRSRVRPGYLCDSAPLSVSSKDWSTASYSQNAKVPVVTKDGRFNKRAVRQLSTGSIAGLVAGLAVGWFSKPLVVLLGLAIVGVQTIESYGIRLVPYKTIQRYIKGVDVRSAIQDNVALKVSFGLMFALTGFAEL